MAIKHKFVNPRPQGTDTTVTRPGDWNDDHVIDAGTITLAMLAPLSAPQRLIGSGAGGAAQEVSASQLFDWVSSTNGVLLTRTGGSWGTVANVATDNGDLVLAPNAAPAAPATGKVKLFGGSSGGRPMLGTVGPVGARMLAQPFLGQAHAGWWLPQGVGSGSITVLGLPAPTVLNALTRAVTTTNAFTLARRIGLATTSTAGTVAGARSPAYLCRLQGFHLVCRFGFADVTVVTTGRAFVGLHDDVAAPTDVNPSTLSNILGVGCDANDTVLQLYAAGAAATSRISLGVNFPTNTTIVDIYELALYCPPNGATIGYQVTRLNTGDVASGVISAAAALPATNTLLANHIWRSNGTTAATADIDLMSLYVETEV